MKKQILAALAAAAISFCAVTVPASAADSEAWPYWPDVFGEDEFYSERMPDLRPVYALGKNAAYQPGDVNMDGKIDTKDANLMLLEFTWFTVCEGPHILTQEQAALADVYPGGDAVDLKDIQAVLEYYNLHEVICATTASDSAEESEAWPYWPDVFGEDEFYSEKMPDLRPVYALGKDAAYQPGDVNMDGKVDTKDAFLISLEYTWFTVSEGPHTLTREQAALADVWPGDDAIDMKDIQAVQIWYLYHNVVQVTDMELTEFVAYWVENEALPV